MTEGQNITTIHTLGSWYDNDCLELIDDNRNRYRMNVQELLKIINDLKFTKSKKRVHTYLEIVVNES